MLKIKENWKFLVEKEKEFGTTSKRLSDNDPDIVICKVPKVTRENQSKTSIRNQQ